MLKYDYTIKRDEGDEIKIYSPNLIPKELSDIVYIQGPNSCGKSTLLNLIALGFFAEKLKDDELNPALREKIEDLRHSSHQSLVFDIEIRNESLGTCIKSVKSSFDNKDFKVLKIIDGKEKPINSTDFFKEYKLIYDIPTDPLRRLPELLRELKNSQQDVENSIVQLRKRIDDAINGIREGRNPDRLKELQKLIESIERKENELKEKIKSNQITISWVKEFHYLKHYFHYTKLYDQYSLQINEIENNKSSIEKKELNLSKKERDLIYEVQINMKRGVKIYDELKELLVLIVPIDIKHHLEIFETLDFANEIVQPDIYTDIKDEARFFLNYFRNEQIEDKNSLYSETKFLKNLLDLVEQFQHMNFFVPGTDKNIDEFIEILKVETQKKEGNINRSKNVSACIEKLTELLSIRENVSSNLDKLDSLKRKRKETLALINDESESGILEQLKENKNNAEVKKNFFIKALAQIDIDISEAETRYNEIQNNPVFANFSSYSDSQLSDSINNSESELIGLKEALSKKHKEREVAINEKDRIEKKKPHKYQKYLKQIELLRKTVYEVESKFANYFRDNLNQITSKDVDPKEMNDQQKIYADKVFKYLALKVNFIKHIDTTYKVVKIDTINKEIFTDSNKCIKFTDMGTGQGQGAYLEGILGMNENKKIIALFDEVAMMDSSTLQPIFDKLRELYKRKILLLGIIVQKRDDKVEIRSLI